MEELGSSMALAPSLKGLSAERHLVLLSLGATPFQGAGSLRSTERREAGKRQGERGEKMCG